jgi:hypothetical protein
MITGAASPLMPSTARGAATVLGNGGFGTTTTGKRRRQDHPEVAEHNRQRQHLRDQRQRLLHLANNNLVLDLKSIPAEVWLVGAGVEDLANNTLAPARLIVWQGSLDRPRFPTPSCQQQPSGDVTQFPP